MKRIIDLKVKKYFLTIIFLLSIILSIMIFMVGSTALEQDINIEQQQQRLNEIEQRKREIQKEIERLKQEEVDYQKSLQKIEELLATAEKELQAAKKTYDNTLKEIAKLEEELEIELYDAQSALEKLGKHHRLFTDSVELSGPGGKPIEFTEVVVELPDDTLED